MIYIQHFGNCSKCFSQLNDQIICTKKKLVLYKERVIYIGMQHLNILHLTSAHTIKRLECLFLLFVLNLLYEQTYAIID